MLIAFVKVLVREVGIYNWDIWMFAAFGMKPGLFYLVDIAS